MPWVWLFVAIVCEVTGTLSLKAAEGFTKPIFAVLAVAGYGLAFVSAGFAFRTMPVGVAYAVWSGAGIALVALVGYFLFEQRLDTYALIGIALIIAGVLVLNLLSNITVG
jgi:small multidrug resistance pump